MDCYKRWCVASAPRQNLTRLSCSVPALAVDEQGDSDLDIFIIMDSDLPRYKRPVPFYQDLAGLGISKDIVVYTPSEVEEWKTASCSLVATVLREGKVLYENQVAGNVR